MATFKEVMTDIGNSIRNVKGTTDKIKIADIPSEIDKMAYVNNGTVTGVVDRVDVPMPNVVLDEDNGAVDASIDPIKGYVDSVAKSCLFELPVQGAQTITPSTTDKVIEKGKFLTGNQTIIGEPNLIPENIIRGLDPVKKDSNGDPIRLAVFGVEGTLDKIHPIGGYTGGSGFYGMQVADVAKSYHFARTAKLARFQYNQGANPFNGNITDANGNCLFDCSSFANFVLRGIPFDKSPFNGNSGKENINWNQSEIATLCEQSEYVWADPWLDRQIDPSFKNIGVSGYYSVRTAAQLAEYFYVKGCIVHEYISDPTAPPDDLLPGDILFWAKEGANTNQKSRFKGISHVGIVAHDKIHYYHVTGTEKDEGDTVFYSSLANKDDNGVYDKLVDLCLILRPNYMPIPKSPIYSPIGVNLLPKYKIAGPITSDGLTKENINGWTRFGITMVQGIDGSLTLNGQATGDLTCYIYGRVHPIKLSAGTYKLSGAPTFNGATIKQWGMGVKQLDQPNGATSDIKNGGVWDNGSGDTFTLSAETWCYVYIYVGSSLTSTITNKIFKPSLIRTS